MKIKSLILIVLATFFSSILVAAPYNGDIMDFPQPDGSSVRVKLFGDEYYMRGESLDGYTLVRDTNGWLCYAELNEEGTLVSNGVHYTNRSSKTNVRSKNGSLEKHLDITTENRNSIVAKNKEALNSDIDVEENIKGKNSSIRAKTRDNTIKGKYKTLVVLVDFSDKPAEVPKNIINDMFNSSNFSYNGNNGSVNQYFKDVSGGLVDYEGVVFGYFRAPKTFEEYDNGPYGSTAREILGQALQWIENQGFDFSTLHTTAGKITAINMMYTGSAKEWSKGMWYHASSYSGFTADGVKSGSYNTSPARSNLTIGTTVHENGHMLCKWPDLYSYDSDATGKDGIGSFCVMASSGGKNPPMPNPYFRTVAGWITPTEVNNFNGVVTEQHDDFKVYKYTNKNNPSEFFLMDVRHKTGRSANIPDNGLTIWHIDRDESQQVIHNDNGGTEASRREVYLEHANNDMDKHSGACFHATNTNAFNDSSTPNAKWYDNTNSGLKVSEISAEGLTMTYRLGVINQETKGPYTGTPIAIPGVLEAENYDKGGQAVSYNDTDVTNNGAVYRTDGVDIGGTASKYNIGWTAAGEWLEYTVNISETTTYIAEFLTSSLNGGGSLGLTLDGTSILSAASVASTSDWSVYQPFTKEVNLIKGKHVIRINIEKAGFNLDKITFTKKPTCSITSYINVNNGGWNKQDTVNVNIGGNVWFGPQSSTTQGQSTTGWTWTGPNNFSSNKRDHTLNNVQELHAGTYTVAYTDPNGCKATSSIVINKPCEIISYVNINDQNWDITSEVTVFEGDEIWFGPQSNISGVPVAGWAWTGPNNYANQNRAISLKKITLSQAGEYVVNFTTPSGCKSSHAITVAVSTVTALENDPDKSFTVYPNPSTGGQFQLTQSVSWEVYSTQGILINKGESQVIDLVNQPKGMYFLKTESSMVKMIIQ